VALYPRRRVRLRVQGTTGHQPSVLELTSVTCVTRTGEAPLRGPQGAELLALPRSRGTRCNTDFGGSLPSFSPKMQGTVACESPPCFLFCAVCLNSANSNTWLVSSCGHPFHRECWRCVPRGARCPTCRSEIEGTTNVYVSETETSRSEASVEPISREAYQGALDMLRLVRSQLDEEHAGGALVERELNGRNMIVIFWYLVVAVSAKYHLLMERLKTD